MSFEDPQYILFCANCLRTDVSVETILNVVENYDYVKLPAAFVAYISSRNELVYVFRDILTAKIKKWCNGIDVDFITEIVQVCTQPALNVLRDIVPQNVLEQGITAAGKYVNYKWE